MSKEKLKPIREVYFFILGISTLFQIICIKEKDPHKHYEGRKK